MAADIPKSSSPEYQAKFLGDNTLALLDVTEVGAIEIVHDWERLGAETYVTDFIVRRGDRDEHLIAKSCIKFCPLETMGDWLTRRHTLSDNGVSVPGLFAVDRATLIEEYIPYTFKEAYSLAENEHQDTLRAAFIKTYLQITGAGFSPMSLHDIRSRGQDAVMIDFGEDLGASSPILSCALSTVTNAEKAFRRVVS